ncbi:hypothetical protein ILUMI_06441 [Ignelater luminosus]|uniref:Uncharacterized protein n=1 Tax=Ignelater luminosus TaxID=2038154 RepID=A0A8K0DAN4_IGNLU|nr:hypothetical protein ILUMI_06441 [Ignelater luminosus]
MKLKKDERDTRIGQNMHKEVRNFYQGTKKLKAGYQTRTIALETKSKGRIVDNCNIDRTWKDYFRKLLNGEEDSNEEQTQAHMQERNEDEEKMHPPDLEEHDKEQRNYIKEVTKGIANLDGDEEIQALGENIIQALKKTSRQHMNNHSTTYKKLVRSGISEKNKKEK